MLYQSLSPKVVKRYGKSMTSCGSDCMRYVCPAALITPATTTSPRCDSITTECAGVVGNPGAAGIEAANDEERET